MPVAILIAVFVAVSFGGPMLAITADKDSDGRIDNRF